MIGCGCLLARDPKKKIEYDNSRSVRTFSLDGYDRGQKIKGQYQE
jgi:hypothetical protein